MLKVYFDESGTHQGSPVITVAGYLSAIEQWTEFESRWQSFLSDERLPAFHMADCEYGYGDFKNQTNEDKLRRIQTAHKIIGETTISGVGISVGTDDYNQVISASPVAEDLTSAYVFCLFGCIQRLAYWALEHDYPDQIACVLEKGSRQGQNIDALERLIRRNRTLRKWFRYSPWAFADKRVALPLQASDIYAYESFKHWNNFFISHRPIRKSLRSLVEQSDFHHSVFGHYYDRVRLERFLKIWLADSEDDIDIIGPEPEL